MNTQGTPNNFTSGFLLVCGINLALFIGGGIFLAIPLAMLLSSLGLEIVGLAITAVFWYIGLSQLIYVIPWVWQTWRSDTTMRNGVITGAIVTILVNSTCFGPGLAQQLFH